MIESFEDRKEYNYRYMINPTKIKNRLELKLFILFAGSITLIICERYILIKKKPEEK